MKAIGITSKAELGRQAKLSAPTVRAILAGQPRSGEDMLDGSLLKLDAGLRWAPDSAAAILAGGDAVELDGAPGGGGPDDPVSLLDGDPTVELLGQMLEDAMAHWTTEFGKLVARVEARFSDIERRIGEP